MEPKGTQREPKGAPREPNGKPAPSHQPIHQTTTKPREPVAWPIELQQGARRSKGNSEAADYGGIGGRSGPAC